uniref:Uncharacterized protein n=1 Tax=Chromera velia CCMP2878 TaxID=1169474 RepID=A0A0G4I8C7_9ALVE|mmetsp:Transcript_54022/g.105663  ORF Transcript_54022/g.105663 Transcript_54022/m.105663 type:complete len:373 (-) Transcript_54022:311-1429(-)|eukprot:Cvel_11890.t1-p1 / transcript=Cvel_11890.t1 / gene=Cvel_11890 / organism=Chromera_velia_CCMP2878 / gene_product=hypothetical protein / transcript_product=hypothetical protein / location=Cvel_scaffold760:37510-40697(+) / protein_length=372 / sequence_SO=supercontig / SO=protein_coding / is_pseudo=false
MGARQVLAVILIGLLPTLDMVIFIAWLHRAEIAMGVFHLLMLSVPVLYAKASGTAAEKYRYLCRLLQCQKERLLRQLPAALVICLITIVGGCLSYLLFRCEGGPLGFSMQVPFPGGSKELKMCISLYAEELPNWGLGYPKWLLFIFGTYFVIVNPVFEEYFWRVFLLYELASSQRASEFAPLCNDIEQGGITQDPQMSKQKKGGPAGSSTEGGQQQGDEEKSGSAEEAVGLDKGESAPTGGAATTDKKAGEADLEAGGAVVFLGTVQRPGGAEEEEEDPELSVASSLEPHSLLVSCLYGLYHVVVVYCLLRGNATIALLAFVGLVAVGRFWIFCRGTVSLGLTTAIIMHGGVDVCVVFGIADVVFKLVPPWS